MGLFGPADERAHRFAKMGSGGSSHIGRKQWGEFVATVRGRSTKRWSDLARTPRRSCVVNSCRATEHKMTR
jgi:hypothetical protein